MFALKFSENTVYFNKTAIAEGLLGTRINDQTRDYF